MKTESDEYKEKDGEPSSEESSQKDGVVIPEEFQQQTHELLKGAATKHHLNHVSDRVNAKRDEMSKAEMEAETSNPKQKKVPATLDTVGMPSD